jgi:hypothetical protein
MIDFKSKRVQFAIGLAVILIGLKWLFSNTLGDAYLAFTAPEVEEGNTGNLLDLYAKLAPFIDIAVAFVIGVGAYTVRFGEWIYGKIKEEEPVPETPQNSSDIIRDFAKAAAVNDPGALKELQFQIRQPYAIDELVAAVKEFDRDKVDVLLEELIRE